MKYVIITNKKIKVSEVSPVWIPPGINGTTPTNKKLNTARFRCCLLFKIAKPLCIAGINTRKIAYAVTYHHLLVKIGKNPVRIDFALISSLSKIE